MNATDGSKAKSPVRTFKQDGKAAQRSPDKAATMARAAARRQRHRQRRWAVRLLVVLAGLLLCIAGLPLLVVIPEVSLPLLVMGLGLLALEYEWAARAQGWIEWRVLQVRHWWKSQPLVLKGGVVVLLVTILALVVWWFFF